ncbi:2527_t:CDS:2, partial [Paraglomus brasilianum]
MTERGRGSSRGGSGSRGGSRGGRGGSRTGNTLGQDQKPKKESILDLTKYTEKKIRVKFNGGREVTGILKGFDPLLNLVLDETEENLR